MVPVTSLWLPILVSAVVVFFVSFLLHMVLTYHRSDHKKVPAENEVMEALRRFDIPPGDYMLPYCASPDAMKSPEMQEKWAKGPIAIMTVLKAGPPTMGPQLLLWFLYSIVVGVFAAYVAGLALPSGAEYRIVFRFTGTVAFVGYALALVQQSIWYHRTWSTTWKIAFDGLIYGLATGGVFGWLWPN